MKKTLIGHTGFVGSNLMEQTAFQACYNSKNIQDIAHTTHDLIVCAGVRAVKWLANQQPEEDLAEIKKLISHLEQVEAKQFVLISTVDVYSDPQNVTERDLPDPDQQEPYGKNRYYLETWVKEHFAHALILRLPGLFGPFLKKNLVYDLLHPLPAMITPSLWQHIVNLYSKTEIDFISEAYQKDSLGHYRLQPMNFDIQSKLIALFERSHISSLMFTDSRSVFQFYPLKRLWQDIERALQANFPLLNLAVPPIEARELVRALTGQDFSNRLADKKPLLYDMKSIYAEQLGGQEGYLYSKTDLLAWIAQFMNEAVRARQ